MIGRERNWTLIVLLALASVVGASAEVCADTYLVDQGGSGDFLTIQEGLDAATYGDTVLVAAGAYEEYLVVAEANDGVVVLSVEGPEATVLQGHNDGFTLVRFGGVGRDTKFEGFTLRDNFYIDGAAMLCQAGAAPEIRGNIFVNNHASSVGGAIACIASASPLIVENEFYDNIGGEGGAISVSPAGHVEIIDNIFQGNTAVGFSANWGGAVSIWGAMATVTGNLFRENSAAMYGGAILVHDASPTISGNVFDRNTADDGGAIAMEAGGSCSILDNTFTANEATGGSSRGGAILSSGFATPMGSGNVFYSNTASVGNSFAFFPPSGGVSFEHCSFLGGESHEIAIVGAAEPETLAFLECWWGATDADSIASLIWDCADDPLIQSCVDFAGWCYDPSCSGQATTVPEDGAATWGHIKNLFRE